MQLKVTNKGLKYLDKTCERRAGNVTPGAWGFYVADHVVGKIRSFTDPAPNAEGIVITHVHYSTKIVYRHEVNATSLTEAGIRPPGELHFVAILSKRSDGWKVESRQGDDE